MISISIRRATALAVSVIVTCLIGVTTAAAVSAHRAGQPSDGRSPPRR